MDISFLEAFLLMFIAIDPIMIVPIFANLTDGFNRKQCRKVYIKAFLVSTLLLLTFWLFGESVLGHFGIRMTSFKIIGGLFLIAIAYNMLFDKRSERKANTAEEAIDDKTLDDIAVFPLSIPLIAGPASLATAVLLGEGKGDTFESYMLSLGPILLVSIITLIAMIATSKISRFLGPTILTVTEKLLGLLLGALAIEFIIEGIETTFNLV
jgi:multiple antibiotic resistance protein